MNFSGTLYLVINAAERWCSGLFLALNSHLSISGVFLIILGWESHHNVIEMKEITWLRNVLQN